MRSGSASLVGNSRATFAIGNRQSKIDNLVWGHSSVGRAPALQAGSQGFESPCLQSTLTAGVDCRAGALAKADSYGRMTRYAVSYDSAGQSQLVDRPLRRAMLRLIVRQLPDTL